MGVGGAGSNVMTIMTEEGHRIRSISCPQDVVQFGALQECGGGRGGASGTGRGVDVRLAQHPGKKSTERRRFEGRVRRRNGEEVRVM